MGETGPDENLLNEVRAHIDEWHASAKRTKYFEEKFRKIRVHISFVNC